MTDSQAKRSSHDKSKGYQYKNTKRQLLEIGQRGFLATCNFRERDCVRECYNLLGQYANELFGPEAKADAKTDEEPPKEEQTETDISDDLQNEIDAAKAAAQPGRSRRFQVVDTGTKNCVFIKTTLKDPVALGTAIIKDIAENKVQKTRYLLRLTPIDAVCKASVDDITKAGEALCDKYFHGEPKTFSIVFNKRFNNDIKRDEIIKILADVVIGKNCRNKVDLSNPEFSLIVEILKGKCCLSVLEGYNKYRKYNLVELCSARPEKEDKADGKKSDEAANGGGDKRKPEESVADEKVSPVAEEEPDAKKLKSNSEVTEPATKTIDN